MRCDVTFSLESSWKYDMLGGGRSWWESCIGWCRQKKNSAWTAGEEKRNVKKSGE